MTPLSQSLESAKVQLRRSSAYYHWFRARRAAKGIAWAAQGGGLPVPAWVKESALRRLGREHGLRTLVETGTCFGEMSYALHRDFDRIVTVELSDSLYAFCKQRFAGHHNVEVIHGDSASVLPQILANLEEPALFWLDAHYSGGDTARGELDSPISTELSLVLGHPVPGHVVVIDDAAHFVGRDGYPPIDELLASVRVIRPDMAVSVRNNAIFLEP